MAPERVVSASLRHARLVAEREALAAAVPPEVGAERAVAGGHVRLLEQRLKELREANGWDLWRGTPVGQAAIDWQRTLSEQRRCLAEAKGAGLRWGHQLRQQAKRAAERAGPLQERFDQLAAPEQARIEAELPKAKRRVAELDGQHEARGRSNTGTQKPSSGSSGWTRESGEPPTSSTWSARSSTASRHKNPTAQNDTAISSEP